MIIYLLFCTNATDDKRWLVDPFSSVEAARGHVQSEHPGTEWISLTESRWTPRSKWGASYRYDIEERTVR